MALHMAVASTNPDFSGTIPELFSTAPYLLIVDAETGELIHVEKRSDGGDEALARAVLKWNCEGVVCGPLESVPFDIIAMEGNATRYDGSGMTIPEALDLLEFNRLEYIKDSIGGEGCPSHGKTHFCDGHDHDHDHHHHHN